MFSFRAVRWMKKYLRYTDYLGAAQLYLKDNFFLEKPLELSHIKSRILGHWGTVPGLNLIYAGLNYLVTKNKCSVLLITGPGHGAPAILANVFAEKTISDVYPDYPFNGKGAGKLIHDFSWPYTKFPSHVTPTVPGSILEGGELGYSLSTAFGAVFDNPNLIVAAIIGDGEAESGPLAAAWHSNKFLNPKTSGAVLPIVHVNGYKISNPTLYGTMSDEELRHLFIGYGYEPLFIEGKNLERKILTTLEYAYEKIRAIQTKVRDQKKPIHKPRWPMIIMRSIKGWTGVHRFGGHAIEGSFRSHGVPIDNLLKDEKAFMAVKKWLESYRVRDLIDEHGRPKPEVLRFVPQGKWRIGMNPHAVGGKMMKELKLPTLTKYETKFKGRGTVFPSSMDQAGQFFRDLIVANPHNFRMMCPDELESNKLEKIFEKTNRAYIWPVKSAAENIAQDGRAMEMLSEHTLQGWLQGYLLTGRYGVFVTYEAFALIIASMVDQYAKFLKQSFKVKWRKPIPSAIYILSSVGWRQEHNGYSHQNPSFVSNVLEKHGQFSQIYYPADANMLLAALEETLKRKNSICVIVAGKRPLPAWLTLKEARDQAKHGIGIWDWVGGKEASRNPDVVLVSAGDYITEEALYAVELCRQMAPELKIRYVNVSELTSLCLGDFKTDRPCVTESSLAKYFTHDKPVVFSYHGYTNDIEQILWPYENSARFSIHGYKEEGSTTTSFDIKVRNGVSRYQLAIDLIQQGAKRKPAFAKKASALVRELNAKLDAHHRYVIKNGDDPPEVKAMRWE